ncbi:MAG TPA: peptidoglycan editing factor PgeF [Acetobacteraceae bacterium]|nr:peptidoglycan editing factor PgeF [Acetobacteraceae bacterium]
MKPDFLTARLAAPHGFFTRLGGVSEGAYGSLNCGLSGADDPACVAENRRRAAIAVGAAPASLAGLRQVHGARVIGVTEPWAPGAGPDADAMVTDRPGIALGIITADCAPVLFADATGRVVGAAHAGWRGALAGVLEAVLDSMRALGAEGITAVIGPCIHQQSYEVGDDLRDAVLAREAGDSRFFHPNEAGRHQFDLPGYCAARLREAGIAAAILPDDTYTDERRFFSHRRRTKRAEGPGGHQISIIMRAA